MRQETLFIPRTRQGVRDLDRIKGNFLPASGGPPRPGSGVNVGDNERVASAVAGAMLTMLGLRGGAVGLAALAAGGALLWRGATGHCAVYQALGRSTAGPTSAEVVYRPG
jgi:uncharacterized membrane protein